MTEFDCDDIDFSENKSLGLSAVLCDIEIGNENDWNSYVLETVKRGEGQSRPTQTVHME